MICAPGDFAAVKAALEKAGPQAGARRGHHEADDRERSSPARRRRSMRKLLDALENLDDVQDVYTTAVID